MASLIPMIMILPQNWLKSHDDLCATIRGSRRSNLSERKLDGTLPEPRNSLDLFSPRRGPLLRANQVAGTYSGQAYSGWPPSPRTICAGPLSPPCSRPESMSSPCRSWPAMPNRPLPPATTGAVKLPSARRRRASASRSAHKTPALATPTSHLGSWLEGTEGPKHFPAVLLALKEQG